jgi:hypothetical protein
MALRDALNRFHPAAARPKTSAAPSVTAAARRVGRARGRGRGRAWSRFKRGARSYGREGRSQITRRGKASVRELGQTSGDYAEKRIRNPAADGRQWNGIFADDSREGLYCSRTHEGAPAREHLVCDEAERELVGTEVHRSPGRLLRRHVAHGSEDRAFERSGNRGRCHGLDRRRRGLERVDEGLPGQTEIKNLRAPIRPQHDVLRLEVAVDDALCMRGGESVGDLECDRAGVPNRDWSVGKRLPQSSPIDPLHRDPGDAVSVSDVVHGDDGRMIQSGGRPGLELEAPTKRRISDQLRRNHFEGDVASQPRVAAAIDLSHSPNADEGLDLVRTEPVSGLQRVYCDDAAERRWRRQ